MKISYNTKDHSARFFFDFLMVSGITILYPFANVIDLYLDQNIYGFALLNGLLFSIIIVLGVSSLMKLTYDKRDLANNIFMISCIAFMIIINTSQNLNENSLSLTSILASNRFLILPYLGFVFLQKILNNHNIIVQVSKILILSGILCAAFRIINFYVFPNYSVFGGAIIDYSERNRDMLQGSSMIANIILVSMFALVDSYLKKSIKIPTTIFSSVMIIMFLAILTSGSRYPQSIAILIVLYGFLRLHFLYKILVLLLASLYLYACLTGFYSHPEVILRSFDNTGGRVDKFYLAMSIIFTSIESFLFGTSNAIMDSSRALNNITVSDNSYMLLAMRYGVPLTIFWFICMISFFKKYSLSFLLYFYSIYIIVGLFITNCILWDSWVFISILGFICMSYQSTIKEI